MPLSGCPAFPRRPLYAPLPVSLAASLYASLCIHAVCRTNEPQVPPSSFGYPLVFWPFSRLFARLSSVPESHPRCSGPSLRRPPGDVQHDSSQVGGDGTFRQPPPPFCTPGIRQAARGRQCLALRSGHVWCSLGLLPLTSLNPRCPSPPCAGRPTDGQHPRDC
jgi:hypothetical protein